jgi:ABC-type uncharacterized transport system permease subunit
MYLIQHRRLKTRHAEPTGFHLPSLSRLAQLNRWSMMLTWFLLTLGLGSGIYLLLKGPGESTAVGFGDPAVIVSGLVWLLFGAIFGRLISQRTPTGRQVAWLTICGCGFLLATLLSLQVIGSIHGGTGHRLSTSDGNARAGS